MAIRTFNLQGVQAFLKSKNIEFTLDYGLDRFTYTIILFQNEKVACKAYDLLKLEGTGPIQHGDKYGIKFY